MKNYALSLDCSSGQVMNLVRLESNSAMRIHPLVVSLSNHSADVTGFILTL